MKLRPMLRGELDRVLNWAAAEGWNPGLDDAAAFYGTDPAGFFVAEVDGAPVACISVVNHSDDLAFLGLYLCRPDYRGRGIGLALWGHALSHAGDRTVGLDGVPAQEANYAASGFQRVGATLRYSGPLADGHAEPGPDLVLRAAVPKDTAALIALDAAANGHAKPVFLRHWLGPSNSRATIVLQGSAAQQGFATWRHCRDGIKIGPLVAPDTSGAVALIRACAAAGGAAPVIVDVPERFGDLAAFCESAGMRCAFSTARMYRGPAPVVGPAVATPATLELG